MNLITIFSSVDLRIFKIRIRSDEAATRQHLGLQIIITYQLREDPVRPVTRPGISAQRHFQLHALKSSLERRSDHLRQYLILVDSNKHVFWSVPNENNDNNKKKRNTKATRQTGTNPWNSDEIIVTRSPNFPRLGDRHNLRSLLLIPRKKNPARKTSVVFMRLSENGFKRKKVEN